MGLCIIFPGILSWSNQLWQYLDIWYIPPPLHISSNMIRFISNLPKNFKLQLWSSEGYICKGFRFKGKYLFKRGKGVYYFYRVCGVWQNKCQEHKERGIGWGEGGWLTNIRIFWSPFFPGPEFFFINFLAEYIYFLFLCTFLNPSLTQLSDICKKNSFVNIISLNLLNVHLREDI